MSTIPIKTEMSKEGVVKGIPLRRFEMALNKFTDVAIPLHLNLLKKHKDNIRKFQLLGEWDRVHREQVNASRTVQQLKADVWEVEKVRQQIRPEDLVLFDKRVEPVKILALDAVHDFIEEHKEVSDPTKLIKSAKSKPQTLPDDVTEKVAGLGGHVDEIVVDGKDPSQQQVQEQVEKVPPQSSEALSSWRRLYNDLIGLNEMIHKFSGAVHRQQASVDSIENNVEEAHENVREGTWQLSKASKYKAAMLPITGALIGSLAGPIGMMAGFKIGGIAAAVGGSLLGFQSGRYLKNRQEKITDSEMEMLSIEMKQKSVSLPDVNDSNSNNS